MSQAARFSGDVAIDGSLSASSGITGQNRSGINADTSQSYELPLTDFRVWDDFSIVLPDTASTSGLVVASFPYEPTVLDSTFFVANRDYRVVGITGRVEVIGTGGACTAVIKKATSGTDIASGTALHSSSFNLVGTVDTNQTLTLSTTATDLNIASGTAIGFDLTGTPTSARGVISVYMLPISNDDLAISSGAFATGLPYIHTGNLKSAGSVTRYARTMFTIPPEFVSAGAFQFRFASGMLTTVADTAATIDCECYKTARSTLKTGSDLVSTSASSINSLSFAEKTFDVSSTGLIAGDVLDIRVAILVNDAGSSTVVDGAIAHAEALLTIKG
jgi:hypothetical protein